MSKFINQNELKHYQLYIDGKWVSSKSNKFVEVKNPATEEVVGYVTDADAEDVKKALESSERAQLLWQEVPILKRVDYLESLNEKIRESKEKLARIITMEQGKTYRESLCEVDDTINYIKQAIEGAKRIKDEILPVKNTNEGLIFMRVPYGVTIGLCAWNYPLALIGRKLGPALITGNSIIIKPHELTPLATAEFFNIINESNLPKGLVNLITGSGVETGRLLVENPITKLVNVTGSVGAGQAIYKSSSKNINGLILELGGKAPFIVMDDADIDKAVDAAVISRFANCGQVCTCCDMIYVQESVAKEFTEKLLEKVSKIKVGDPFDSATTMGPKMCESDVNKIDLIVRKTIEQGATLLCGGERPKGECFKKGYWYEPTVLGDVTEDMEAAQKETFGPLLPILKIKDFAQAIRMTNKLPYGLAAYLFTNNYHLMIEASSKLQVGTIFINKCITGYTHGFHSGHKLSGLMGEDGEYGLEAYMQKRILYVNY